MTTIERYAEPVTPVGGPLIRPYTEQEQAITAYDMTAPPADQIRRQLATFVIDRNNTIVHADYVNDQMNEPNYGAAVEAARKAAGQ